MSGLKLEGKVVAITGGANGIGAETARRLVESGARVGLLDRDFACATALAAHLGDAVIAVDTDVTSMGSIEAALAEVNRAFGGIDAVLAGAGISGPVATVGSIDPAQFESVVDINLLGVWRTARASLAYLEQSRGYLIMIASVMAAVPAPTAAAYGASKAGVEAFGRALRLELAQSPVDVGVAYFGLINTTMVSGVLDSGTGLDTAVAKLPGFISRPAPVSAAADAIINGIKHRQRRVWAPRYVGGVLALREALAAADPMLGKVPTLGSVVRGAGGER